MSDTIYLDYQATTPLAPEAFEAMVPWLRDKFANPHSAHKLGREAAAAIEVARAQVAALMPDGGQVIFTGSATEAINLAIKGAVDWQSGCRFAFSAIEHAAVTDVADEIGRIGRTSAWPVTADGVVDQSVDLASDINMIAVMLLNNEIGTIQPVEEIAARAKEVGALMLCDAVQAFGRMPIPDGPDMIAVSAHKIHGPKGIGALWVRDGVELREQIHGGGQEQGLRSGTLSPSLCVGFGAAAKLAAALIDEDMAHVTRLADIAREAFADWTINGSVEHRYPGNLNIRRESLDVARLMSDCRGVAFSAGSACASGSGRPSHVLRAIGLTDAQAKNSIRLGFGRYTTEDEIREAAKMINAAAEAQL